MGMCFLFPFPSLSSFFSLTKDATAFAFSQRSADKCTDYEVGERVEANYRNFGMWYPGTVVKVRQSNKGTSYAVNFDDGDYEGNVTTSRLRKIEGSILTASALLGRRRAASTSSNSSERSSKAAKVSSTSTAGTASASKKRPASTASKANVCTCHKKRCPTCRQCRETHCTCRTNITVESATAAVAAAAEEEDDDEGAMDDDDKLVYCDQCEKWRKLDDAATFEKFTQDDAIFYCEMVGRECTERCDAGTDTDALSGEGAAATTAADAVVLDRASGAAAAVSVVDMFLQQPQEMRPPAGIVSNRIAEEKGVAEENLPSSAAAFATLPAHPAVPTPNAPSPSTVGVWPDKTTSAPTATAAAAAAAAAADTHADRIQMESDDKTLLALAGQTQGCIGVPGGIASTPGPAAAIDHTAQAVAAQPAAATARMPTTTAMPANAAATHFPDQPYDASTNQAQNYPQSHTPLQALPVTPAVAAVAVADAGATAAALLAPPKPASTHVRVWETRNNLPPALRELLSFNSKGADDDWDVYKTRVRSRPARLEINHAPASAEKTQKGAKRRKSSTDSSPYSASSSPTRTAGGAAAIMSPASSYATPIPTVNAGVGAGAGAGANVLRGWANKPKLFRCDYCSRSFSNPANFRQHAAAKHGAQAGEDAAAKAAAILASQPRKVSSTTANDYAAASGGLVPKQKCGGFGTKSAALAESMKQKKVAGTAAAGAAGRFRADAVGSSVKPSKRKGNGPGRSGGGVFKAPSAQSARPSVTTFTELPPPTNMSQEKAKAISSFALRFMKLAQNIASTPANS